MQVKGKAEPMPIWRVLGARSRLGVDVARAPRDAAGRPRRRAGPAAAAVPAGACGSSRAAGHRRRRAGVGKSRLVRELAGSLDAQPDLVAWRQGRCLPYGEGVTFWALGEIVKAQAGILESDDPRTVAARSSGRPSRRVVDDPAEREWLRRGSRRWSGWPAARRPTGAGGVVRGLAAVPRGWSRPAAAGPGDRGPALGRRGPAGLPRAPGRGATGADLLVVATARPELFERAPAGAEGARTRPTRAVAARPTRRPPGCSPACSAGGAPGRGPVAAAGAGGRQPAVRRGVRPAAHRPGAARPRQGPPGGRVRDAAARHGAGPDRRPPGHAAAGARRCSRTPPWSAGCSGRARWPPWAGGDEAEVRAGLARAGRRGAGPRRRGVVGGGQAEYAFCHALVRDVAYAQIPGGRGPPHRAAAEWLEALAGDRAADHAELIAHHYSQALVLARAAPGGRPGPVGRGGPPIAWSWPVTRR